MNCCPLWGCLSQVASNYGNCLPEVISQGRNSHINFPTLGQALFHQPTANVRSPSVWKGAKDKVAGQLQGKEHHAEDAQEADLEMIEKKRWS